MPVPGTGTASEHDFRQLAPRPVCWVAGRPAHTKSSKQASAGAEVQVWVCPRSPRVSCCGHGRAPPARQVGWAGTWEHPGKGSFKGIGEGAPANHGDSVRSP